MVQRDIPSAYCADAPICSAIDPSAPLPPVSGGDHPTYAVLVERSRDKGRSYQAKATHDTDDWTALVPAHASPAGDGTYLARNGHHLMRWTVTVAMPLEGATIGCGASEIETASDATVPAETPHAVTEGVDGSSEYVPTNTPYIDRCDDVAELREMVDRQRAAMAEARPHAIRLYEETIERLEHRIAWLERQPAPDVALLQEQADFARTLVDEMPQHHDCDQWTTMPFSRVFAGDLTAEGMVENLIGYLDQLFEVIHELTEERDDLARDIEAAARLMDDSLIFRDSTRLVDAYRELAGSRPLYAVPAFAA